MKQHSITLFLVLFLSIPLTSAFSQAQTLQKYPNIINASIEISGSGFRFDVTVSSPYDTPQRYADAYRIKDEFGHVYGIRELSHDHANEQPFTRSISGVKIPKHIEKLMIEGRDKTYGWGGSTFTIEVPSSQ